MNAHSNIETPKSIAISIYKQNPYNEKIRKLLIEIFNWCEWYLPFMRENILNEIKEIGIELNKRP